jgi:hypothetical protein
MCNRHVAGEPDEWGTQYAAVGQPAAQAHCKGAQGNYGQSMTQGIDDPSSAQRSRTHLLHLEFDGDHLTIVTDLEPIAKFVRATYRHMLVNVSTSSVGVISVMQRDGGYVLVSAETLELTGDSCDPLMPYLKEEVVTQFMRARPDLLWVHAGAVERDNCAVLLAAASGQGKSTLTTLLCERGWRLMSDDVAPIRMDRDDVLPFNQLPQRRVDPGKHLSPEDVASLPRESINLSEESVRRDSAQIRAIVFPEFKRGSKAELIPIRQGDGALELLRNSRNLIDHKGAAVERAATIGRGVPMFRLCYGIATEGANLINEIT